MNEGKGQDEAGRVQLGQGLQALVKGENFILRAEGLWMASLWLLCTEMVEELREFGAEDRQRSGGTKPSALNPWQWEEENV